MEWGLLLKVLAMVLIIEGIMPFVTPIRWKKYLQRMIEANNRQVRIMGFVLLVVGSVLLFVAHDLFRV